MLASTYLGVYILGVVPGGRMTFSLIHFSHRNVSASIVKCCVVFSGVDAFSCAPPEEKKPLLDALKALM